MGCVSMTTILAALGIFLVLAPLTFILLIGVGAVVGTSLGFSAGAAYDIYRRNTLPELYPDEVSAFYGPLPNQLPNISIVNAEQEVKPVETPSAPLPAPSEKVVTYSSAFLFWNFFRPESASSSLELGVLSQPKGLPVAGAIDRPK